MLGASLDIPRLYEAARALLQRFNNDSSFPHAQASLEEFHARVVRAAETQGVTQSDDQVRLDGFLLPKILQDVTDRNVMQRVTAWLEKQESGAA